MSLTNPSQTYQMVKVYKAIRSYFSECDKTHLSLLTKNTSSYYCMTKMILNYRIFYFLRKPQNERSATTEMDAADTAGASWQAKH